MIESAIGQAFLLMVGAVAVFCATMVVLARKAFYSALFLVLTIVCVAVLYLSLSAEFLAAVQLIVYAGAVVILFVFVVMLLNPRVDGGPQGPGMFVPLAIVLALALLAQVGAAVSLIAVPGAAAFPPPDAGWGDSTTAIGKLLFSEQALPFELTSVLLLIAILGATTLGRERDGATRRSVGTNLDTAQSADAGAGTEVRQ